MSHLINTLAMKFRVENKLMNTVFRPMSVLDCVFYGMIALEFQSLKECFGEGSFFPKHYNFKG